MGVGRSCSRNEGDLVGDPHEVGAGNGQELGKPTLAVDPERARIGAVRRPAGPAPAATAAGDRRLHRHPQPRRHGARAVRDDAGGIDALDHRERHRSTRPDTSLVHHAVEPVHAGRLHPHQHLSRETLGIGDIGDFDRPAGGRRDCGLHRSPTAESATGSIVRILGARARTMAGRQGERCNARR